MSEEKKEEKQILHSELNSKGELVSKKMDYYEFSNMNQGDYVELLETLDKAIAIAVKNNIPLITAFVTKNDVATFSAYYSHSKCETEPPRNEHGIPNKLVCLVGSVIRHFRRDFGMHLNFDHFGPPTDPDLQPPKP